MRMTRFPSVLAFLAACAVLPAQALTGAWQGEMVGDDGERVFMTYTFSPRGALVLQMPSDSGMRTVEVAWPGQVERWRPPAGGVATGRVLSLSAGPDHFLARVSVSAERNLFEGVLQQETLDLSLEFQQQGERVFATVRNRTESTTTGGPFAARPQRSDTLHRGVLQRPW